jgi:NADH:ubiquinone oxidoreductase subunit C
MPDLEWQRVHGYVELKVPPGRLVEIAQRLRDQFEYDYLSAVTAVDWPDRIEMVYHLYSFNYAQRPGCVVLRVDLERPSLPEYPLVDSLTRLWPGADFQEREVYDLMGVKFLGHPDLRRILLADDFPGHPLRKDFVFDYEYVLVNHLRYGVEGQLAPGDGPGRSPN